MNNQMEMAFLKEGGIKDDGMKKDPVSGNSVPPGSMAKEVRDDIPAMLSEGEYVIPADVLRYYGVNFFEKLRGQAKQGLNTMEQNGRIGGTPMTDQDVARNMQQVSPPPQPMAPPPVQAAQGTLVQGFNEGPMPTASNYTSSWSPAKARYSSPMFQGTSSQERNIQTAQEQATNEEITQLRNHYNQAGESIQIKYAGTSLDNMSVAEGQEDLLSQYPLTEEEYGAYKKEMVKTGGGGGDGGGTTEVSGGSDTSWMDGIDFKDKASVQKWVDSKEGLGMSPEARKIAGMGGVFGAIPQAIQAQDIAKVRGLAVAFAASDPEFSKELFKSAQAAINDSGSLVISAFDRLGLLSGSEAAKQLNTNIVDLALTRNSVNAYGKSIFKDESEWESQLQSTAPAGMTYDSGMKSTVTDPGTGETFEVTGGYSREEGGGNDWMSDWEGIEKIDSDTVNAYEITDSEAFTNSGGVRPQARPETGANAGGLMTNLKQKKKKKSKPKQTGLAGKK